MLQQTTETIQRLNDALIGSIEFYSAAANIANAETNRSTFNRIATARLGILTYLQSDNPEKQFKNYSFGSALQKVYPDMFLGLAGQGDPLLIKQTHEHEASLHIELQEILETIYTPELVAVLLDVFPQLNGSHMNLLLEDAS